MLKRTLALPGRGKLAAPCYQQRTYNVFGDDDKNAAE